MKLLKNKKSSRKKAENNPNFAENLHFDDVSIIIDVENDSFQFIYFKNGEQILVK